MTNTAPIIDAMTDTEDRKLIETFPGLPEGAGIYELPDGSTKFFNCAPGTVLADPDALPDFEGFFEVVNDTTGEIRFIESDSFYKTLKQALMAAGSSIERIKTYEQLMYALSSKGFGQQITRLIKEKWRNRTPTTTQQAMSRAAILGDTEEAAKQRKKLERRRSVGLKSVD